jgi:hypothetical protein
MGRVDRIRILCIYIYIYIYISIIVSMYIWRVDDDSKFFSNLLNIDYFLQSSDL